MCPFLLRALNRTEAENREKLYLAKRAKENFWLTFNSMVLLAFCTTALSVTYGVVYGIKWFFIWYFTRAFPFCVVVLVLRNTKFGKRNVETIAAVTFTLALMFFGYGDSVDLKAIVTNKQRCNALNISSHFPDGTLYEHGFNISETWMNLGFPSGDYCSDLSSCSFQLRFLSSQIRWLQFTLIGIIVFRFRVTTSAFVVMVPLSFRLMLIIPKNSIYSSNVGVAIGGALLYLVPALIVCLGFPHIHEKLHRANYALNLKQEQLIKRETSRANDAEEERKRVAQENERVGRENEALKEDLESAKKLVDEAGDLVS